MKNISLRLPDKILKEIDNLVLQGIYASRTEALREGARIILRTHIGIFPGLPKEISKDEVWEEFLREKGFK